MMCVKYTMFKNVQDNCTFLTNCCTTVNMSNIQVSCMIQMSQPQSKVSFKFEFILNLRMIPNWEISCQECAFKIK